MEGELVEMESSPFKLPHGSHCRMFIIDLAGSENSADAQFHDKSLVAETRAINK